jgi:hypothetical protein
MSNTTMRGNLRSTLRSTFLIGSVLVAMLAAVGLATAQPPVDNPPGATFQGQQYREGVEGIRGNPSPFSRTRHSPEIGNYPKTKAAAHASTSRRHTKKHQSH